MLYGKDVGGGDCNPYLQRIEEKKNEKGVEVLIAIGNKLRNVLRKGKPLKIK